MRRVLTYDLPMKARESSVTNAVPPLQAISIGVLATLVVAKLLDPWPRVKHWN